MIIEFQLFSKDYEENILNCYNSFSYTCPKCGAKARFHRHGTYTRWLASLSANGRVSFETLEILRLKCISCNSTHSILPAEAIPFQIYSLNLLLFLCEEIFIKKKSLRETVSKTGCCMQILYQKLSLFKQTLGYLEFYFRWSLKYLLAAPLSIVDALALLLQPDRMFLDYFHCHGSPLFLKRRSTLSYPLYFAAAFSVFSNPT